ncbi:MAG: hypothetical protein ABIQ64_03785 [Candidatus Saccharimonadales bacterium]
MLKIPKTISISLPHFKNVAHPMQLSPVTIDNDELTRAVAADPDEHDNNWELNERPDEVQLEAFWSQVDDDVKKDPTWFTFDSE